MLDPAKQEYPAKQLSQSQVDEGPVKDEFVSASIEAFGEVPNMFSRPSSPSLDTSEYENTFSLYQGDDLDPRINANTENVVKGMTDEQYANYQHRVQSINQNQNNAELGPSDKGKGKRPQWEDRDIPRVPRNELDISNQEWMLDNFKHLKDHNKDIPAEKDSGFDWISQQLNGDKKFSWKRQQEELEKIAIERNEDAEEQHAILASLKDSVGRTSTLNVKEQTKQAEKQLKALRKCVQELKEVNRTLVLQSHIPKTSNPEKSKVAEAPKAKPVISVKGDPKTEVTPEAGVAPENKALLRSEDIPGANGRWYQLTVG